MTKKITRRDFIKKTTQVATVAGLSGCGIQMKGGSDKQDFDVVIKDGRVFDGLGNEAF